jgi:hypothetical protein
MHLGRLLCGDQGAVRVRTDWMARGADNAVMTVELIQAIAADLSVVVVHKNAEETGPGTSAGTLVALTSTLGLHSQTFTGLKDLVCFEVEVEENAGGSMGGVLYRFLPSTWFDTAAGAP